MEDPKLVLDELARLLAPEGLLLISSPHRGRYVPGNPHHVREFLPQELRAALEPRFESVRLLDQHLMLASVLSEPGHEPELLGGELHRVAHPAGEDGVYTLAMAGGRLPDPGPALAALGPFTEFRLQLEHMSAQADHIARQQRRIDELEAVERTRLHALRRVAELETEQSRLVDQLAKQELELEAARRRVARVERQIGAITSSRTWRYTGSLRALVRRLRDG